MRQHALSEENVPIDAIVDESEPTVVTRDGQPVGVVMGYGFYRSLMADVELLGDPDGPAILERHRAVQRGETEGFQNLEVSREATTG